MDFLPNLISKKEIQSIIDSISTGDYTYHISVKFRIVSSMEDDQDGIYPYVYLIPCEDEDEYDGLICAVHEIIVSKWTFNCREDENHSRLWFLNGNPISTTKEGEDYLQLFKLVEQIASPFDFEEYAIDEFDGDVFAEFVPYGDPFCLITDGCTFIIEDNDISDFKEEDVKTVLREHMWDQNRIEKAMSTGYELDEDVYDRLCKLDIKYFKGRYEEESEPKMFS